MEAATVTGLTAPSGLERDKAARIVEAMRASVAARGFNASTFDHVARDAGVSRGLLHYYFGTKERLLVEAVRRECDLRHERLDRALAGANSAEQVLEALVETFEEFLGEAPSPAAVMFFEVLTLAQRSDEIAAQLADLGRSTRAFLVDALRDKEQAGALSLKAGAEDAATFLFALADGITVRRMCEPELDIGPVMAQAIIAARALLG